MPDTVNPRLARLGHVLDTIRARCDVPSRLAVDPVGVVHRYADPLTQETVGLLAASMAFGNVTVLRRKVEEALACLGPEALVARGVSEAAMAERLRGWKHRLYVGADVAALVSGVQRVQREAGSLGQRFAADWAREGDLRLALARFVMALREAGVPTLADPSRASACKRLLLYLRWMIRPADGVDLGLWGEHGLSPRILLVPVDTHIQRLGWNLGLTNRASASWKTSEDITAVLRQFCPEDPTRYDFALCHLGMARRCPSTRDAVACRGCGIRSVCRHFSPTGAK